MVYQPNRGHIESMLIWYEQRQYSMYILLHKHNYLVMIRLLPDPFDLCNCNEANISAIYWPLPRVSWTSCNHSISSLSHPLRTQYYRGTGSHTLCMDFNKNNALINIIHRHIRDHRFLLSRVIAMLQAIT